MLKEYYKRILPFIRKGKTLRLLCDDGDGSIQFLDFMLFQANAVSLASYLETFNEEAKGKFCYFAFSSVASLDGPLPKYDDFKEPNGKNMLNEPYESFMVAHELGLCRTLEETSALLGKPIPKTGQEDFLDLHSEWTRRGFKTLRDVLLFYSVTRICMIFEEKLVNIQKS